MLSPRTAAINTSNLLLIAISVGFDIRWSLTFVFGNVGSNRGPMSRLPRSAGLRCASVLLPRSLPNGLPIAPPAAGAAVGERALLPQHQRWIYSPCAEETAFRPVSSAIIRHKRQSVYRERCC